MKWLLLSLAVLFAAIVLVAVVGALLPRSHTATRAASYRQTPQTLYGAIRDVANAASWRSDVESITVLAPEHGEFRWREQSRHGAITYAIVADRPNENLVTRIVDEHLPYGGTWTYTFTPTAEGATVRITENGEVKNPLFRFMARFVFGYTATMEGTLRALGAKFAEQTLPGP